MDSHSVEARGCSQGHQLNGRGVEQVSVLHVPQCHSTHIGKPSDLRNGWPPNFMQGVKFDKLRATRISSMPMCLIRQSSRGGVSVHLHVYGLSYS